MDLLLGLDTLFAIGTGGRVATASLALLRLGILVLRVFG